MNLFPLLAPVAAPAGIDLRCGDVRELVREVRGAAFVHADPPWLYAREAGVANPATHGIYAGMTEADIADVLDAAYDCAEPGARLLCWATWPKLTEFLTAGGPGRRWRYVTGGAWTKILRNGGVGYHWRSTTEPALMFSKPGAAMHIDVSVNHYNGHTSPAEEHSRKPLGWLRTMLRAWTPPGALVLDLWSGLAPMAAACALEGRAYIGAEIDPERHGRALTFLRGAKTTP